MTVAYFRLEFRQSERISRSSITWRSCTDSLSITTKPQPEAVALRPTRLATGCVGRHAGCVVSDSGIDSASVSTARSLTWLLAL